MLAVHLPASGLEPAVDWTTYSCHYEDVRTVIVLALESVKHGQRHARPTDTFPAVGHYYRMTGTKLYCLQ